MNYKNKDDEKIKKVKAAQSTSGVGNNSGNVGYSQKALTSLENGTYSQTRKPTKTTSSSQIVVTKTVPVLQGAQPVSVTKNPSRTDTSISTTRARQNYSNRINYKPIGRSLTKKDSDIVYNAALKMLNNNMTAQEAAEEMRSGRSQTASGMTQAYAKNKNWEKEYGKSLETLIEEFVKDDKSIQRKSQEIGERGGKVGKTAGSVYMNAYLKPVTGAKATISNLINPNSEKAKNADKMARAVSDVSKSARESTTRDMGTVGKTVYNLGTSAADRLAGRVFGDAGHALTAFRTAEDTRESLQDRGITGRGAEAQALAAGAIDAALDIKGLDSIKGLKGLQQSGNLAKSIIGSAAIGGGEQAATSIINEAIDRIANKDKSNYAVNVQNYMAQGMSQKDAKDKAWSDEINTVLQEAGMGALVGTAMGTGGQVARKTANTLVDAATGRNIPSLWTPTKSQEPVIDNAIKQSQDAAGEIERLSQQIPKLEDTEARNERNLERIQDTVPGTRKEQIEQIVKETIPDNNNVELRIDTVDRKGGKKGYYVAEVSGDWSRNIMPGKVYKTEAEAQAELNRIQSGERTQGVGNTDIAKVNDIVRNMSEEEAAGRLLDIEQDLQNNRTAAEKVESNPTLTEKVDDITNHPRYVKPLEGEELDNANETIEQNTREINTIQQRIDAINNNPKNKRNGKLTKKAADEVKSLNAQKKVLNAENTALKKQIKGGIKEVKDVLSKDQYNAIFGQKNSVKSQINFAAKFAGDTPEAKALADKANSLVREYVKTGSGKTALELEKTLKELDDLAKTVNATYKTNRGNTWTYKDWFGEQARYLENLQPVADIYNNEVRMRREAAQGVSNETEVAAESAPVRRSYRELMPENPYFETENYNNLDDQSRINLRDQARAEQLQNYEYTAPRPATQTEYQGFDITKGTNSDVQDALDTGKAFIAEMSPLEYLQRSAYDIEDTSALEGVINGANSIDKVSEYADAMRRGDRFPILSLTYEGKSGRGQEGRTRALAAYEAGIDTIPVAIIGEASENPRNISARNIEPDIPKISDEDLEAAVIEDLIDEGELAPIQEEPVNVPPIPPRNDNPDNPEDNISRRYETLKNSDLFQKSEANMAMLETAKEQGIFNKDVENRAKTQQEALDDYMNDPQAAIDRNLNRQWDSGKDVDTSMLILHDALDDGSQAYTNLVLLKQAQQAKKAGRQLRAYRDYAGTKEGTVQKAGQYLNDKADSVLSSKKAKSDIGTAAERVSSGDIAVLSEKYGMDEANIKNIVDALGQGATKDDVAKMIAMYQAVGKTGVSAEALQKINDIYDQIEKQNLNPNSRARANLEADAFKVLADDIGGKRTWKEQWDSWRYLAMLGNPKTHLRNILGNTTHRMVTEVKDDIGAILEGAVSKVTDIDRTKALLNSDDIGLIQRASDDADNVAYTALNDMGNKYNVKLEIDRARDSFNNPLLSKIDDLNSNALDIEDYSALKRKYSRSLARFLKANGANESIFDASDDASVELMDKARAYAIDQAKQATFHEYSRFADALTQFSKNQRQGNIGNKAVGMVVEGLVPFKKTPTNILKQGVKYSPISLAKSIATMTNAVKTGNKTAADAIEDLASGLTGTGILALGGFLAHEGLLTGGANDNYEVDNAETEQGAQNYALKIGDNSYTLDWLAPLALPLFVGAELANSMSEGTEDDKDAIDKFISAISTVAEPITEMSMLQGIQNALNELSYSPENIISTFLTNATLGYASQGIPTLAGQIARSIDDTRRSTYSDQPAGYKRQLDKTWTKIENKIPFLSMRNEPYVGSNGQTQQNEGIFTAMLGNNGATRFLDQTLSPGYFKQGTVTPVDEELNRLYESTGESVYKNVASGKIGNNPDKLSKEDFTKYQTLYGTNTDAFYNDLVGSLEYEKLDDSERVNALNDAKKISKMIADYEIGGRELKDSEQKVYDIYKQSGKDGIVQYIKDKNTAKSLGLRYDTYKKKQEEYTNPKSAETKAVPSVKKTTNQPATVEEYAKEVKSASDLGIKQDTYAKIGNKAGKNAEKVYNAIPSLKRNGLGSSSAYYTYADALSVDPNLSTADFIKTFNTIDADNSKGIKQDELISYFNSNNVSQDQANKYWKMYGDSEWKKIPKLEGGKYKKVAK